MSSPRYDSPFPKHFGQDSFEYDDDADDLEEGDDESEDTADASEADLDKSEVYTEIKEQMYQDRLANLRKQVQELKDGYHPEYIRINKRLVQENSDRKALSKVSKAYLMERVQRDFVNEMKAAAKEYEEKKIELRENLIAEYEEKRKLIETERHSLDLTGDWMETKPVMTRKLRRRPNDPIPAVMFSSETVPVPALLQALRRTRLVNGPLTPLQVPEKRRKAPPTQLNYLLDEKEIEADLRVVRPSTPQVRRTPLPSGLMSSSVAMTTGSCQEPRIEDGKLRYEKRFFHRGQPVFVKGEEIPRFAANIHNIASDVIWVKKVTDGSKVRIFLSQLSKRKIQIERRVP